MSIYFMMSKNEGVSEIHIREGPQSARHFIDISSAGFDPVTAALRVFAEGMEILSRSLYMSYLIS